MERCEGHDELLKMASSAVTVSDEHGKRLDAIFSVLGEIKTAVDKNAVRAVERDTKLTAIDTKIENGLRKDIRDTRDKVDKLSACIERRKQEREDEQKYGLKGYFSRGWTIFKEKSAEKVVTFFVLGGAAYALWIFSKIKIFHEGNFILKTFGLD